MTIGGTTWQAALQVTCTFLWSFDAKRYTLTHVVPCLQMSSEDNSDQIDSGNAFNGDSSGPLSPVGEQSPEVSWTESSQDSSASQRHEVAEGGGQGNGGARSSGRNQWSCVDLISTISLREAIRIAVKYDVEVAFPQQTRRRHNPPSGHVMVLETFLKFGVRFPLHPYFVRILNHYNLIVFQITPNGWAQMIRLFVLFVERKMDPPTSEKFSWFYTLKSCQGDLGFYYFSKRASKDIRSVIKIRDSNGTWKDPYFYTLEASVRGSFAKPSKFPIVTFCRAR